MGRERITAAKFVPSNRIPQEFLYALSVRHVSRYLAAREASKAGELQTASRNIKSIRNMGGLY